MEDALCPVDWDSFDWGLVPYRLITEGVLHRCLLRSGVCVCLDPSLISLYLPSSYQKRIKWLGGWGWVDSTNIVPESTNIDQCCPGIDQSCVELDQIWPDK